MPNKKYLSHPELTSKHVQEELSTGLTLLRKIHQPIVSFFGSHKSIDARDYDHAQRTAFVLGKKGYGIISGGGPGIMQAANSGAMQAKAPSIGIKAAMIKQENVNNKFFTQVMSCKYLFVRRFLLSIKSQAIIVYPGGYGTLNELFEYAVLMQTNMVDTVPIILVDKKFWKNLSRWLKKIEKKGYISTEHRKIIYYANTTEEIVKIVQKSKK